MGDIPERMHFTCNNNNNYNNIEEYLYNFYNIKINGKYNN
jgi:hypothetical protein